MTFWITQIAGILVHPDREWPKIAREKQAAWQIFKRYLLPLTAIGPVTYHAGLLMEGGYPTDPVAREAVAQLLIISPLTAWLACIMVVCVVSAVGYLAAPLFSGRRNIVQAFTVAVYATTPVWLACLVLVVPLAKFPLLATLIMVGAIHGCYLFSSGVHYLLGVPLERSAEYTAITLTGSAVLCMLMSYAAGAAGLLPLI